MDDQKGLPCISRTLKVNVAVLELFQEHVDIHKHLERPGLEQRSVRGAEPSSARPPGYQIDWLLTLKVNVAVLELFQEHVDSSGYS